MNSARGVHHGTIVWVCRGGEAAWLGNAREYCIIYIEYETIMRRF